ncbi:MAG: hypothetical protein WDW36_009679 [Sanguina aurantia]
MCGIYHDIIYIVFGVQPAHNLCPSPQAAASFTIWGWWLFLLVPAYGLWVLVTKVLWPWWRSPKAAPPVVDEVERKRADRAQVRAERRQAKRR